MQRLALTLLDSLEHASSAFPILGEARAGSSEGIVIFSTDLALDFNEYFTLEVTQMDGNEGVENDAHICRW